MKKITFVQIILQGTCGLTLLGSGAFAASSSWTEKPSWSTGTSPDTSLGGGSVYGKKRAKNSQSKDQDYYPPRPPVTPFSPGSDNLGLDVGQIFLMGSSYSLKEKGAKAPISGSFSDSIGSQLHYTHGVSEMFAFETEFGYSSHSDENAVNRQFSVWRLNGGLRMNLSWFDKVIPYASFGLGFYKPNFDFVEAGSISPILFGVNMGPGVNLEVTKDLFFGVNLTFHDMFGSTRIMDGSGAPFNVDGTFISLLVQTGVTF